MSTEWYIGFDGQVVGPVDQQQLLDFLRGSEQWRQILIWHAGLDAWKAAKDVPDVAEQLAKVPPPLPAPLPAPLPTSMPAPLPASLPTSAKAETPKAEAASEAPSIVPAAPVEAKPAESSAFDPEPAPVIAASTPPVIEPAPAPVAAAPAVEQIVAPAAPIFAAPLFSAPAAQPAMPAPPPPATRRWGWSATALTVLLLVGGAYVAQQVTRRDTSTVAKATQPSSDATIERGFAEIMQTTQLPKKLDDFTTRFDVTQAGKRLVFHHILDTTRYLVPQNFAAAMKEKMLPEACANASREALKAGGTIEYRFHSQAAFPIGSFEVNGADCGNGQPKG